MPPTMDSPACQQKISKHYQTNVEHCCCCCLLLLLLLLLLVEHCCCCCCCCCYYYYYYYYYLLLTTYTARFCAALSPFFSLLSSFLKTAINFPIYFICHPIQCFLMRSSTWSFTRYAIFYNIC